MTDQVHTGNESKPLLLAVTTIEATSFGDHGERLTRAHPYIPGETVEDLTRRVFPRLGRRWAGHDSTDVIELRVVVGHEGPKDGDPDQPPF